MDTKIIIIVVLWPITTMKWNQLKPPKNGFSTWENPPIMIRFRGVVVDSSSIKLSRYLADSSAPAMSSRAFVPLWSWIWNIQFIWSNKPSLKSLKYELHLALIGAPYKWTTEESKGKVPIIYTKWDQTGFHFVTFGLPDSLFKYSLNKILLNASNLAYNGHNKSWERCHMLTNHPEAIL